MRLTPLLSVEDQLVKKPLNLTAAEEGSLPDLLQDAQRSSRLCQCEGRKDMTDRVLNRCSDCGSSCSSLGRKTVSFCGGDELEEVFFADEWDRTPAAVTPKLSYQCVHILFSCFQFLVLSTVVP